MWLIIARDKKAPGRWVAGSMRGQARNPPKTDYGEVAVDAQRLKGWINFLVDHCYLTFAGFRSATAVRGL